MRLASRPTVLLTLGRLPKGLDLARGFAAAGWRVVVAEPYAWHLSRVSRHVHACRQVRPPAAGKQAYLDDLLAIIAREAVELVVPISEETMHVAHLHGRLPAGVRLFAPQPDQVLELHDKLRFIQRSARLGLPVPESAAAGTAAAAALIAGGDVVVKPVFSCAGRGVSIHPAGTLAAEAVPAGCLVQRFLPGTLLSTFALVVEGRCLASVVYRGAVMSGTVAVAFERVEGATAGEQWVERFAALTHHTGFLSFDMVVDGEGVARAIECNPRVTSGVHFLEAASLARAIADPAAPPPALRPERLMQQFWPCLSAVQGRLFRKGSRKALHTLLTARDVTWNARDPLPLLTMPATASGILLRAAREGRSFGDVATDDIGWFEG